MKRIYACLAVLPMAACGGGFRAPPNDVMTPPMTPESALAAAGAVDANTAAAEGTVGGEPRFLGFTVASLGDASQPGLWLETPLVEEEMPGSVIAENGLLLPLTLRPSGGERGSGSRLSLAAFQELGLDLTALPTLTVNANDGTPGTTTGGDG
jgi:hypothetical protein